MDKKVRLLYVLLVILPVLLIFNLTGEAAELPPWPEGWSREEVASGIINLNSLEFNFARADDGIIYYLQAIGRVTEMDLGLFAYQPGKGYQPVRKFSEKAFYIKNLMIVIDKQGRKRLVWSEERRREDYSKYHVLKYACLDRDNQTLIEPMVIYSSNFPLMDPRVDLAADSLLHVIWTGQGETSYDGFHLALTADGEIALPPGALVSNNYSFNRGDLYITEEGLLHFTWTQVEDDGEHLYYGVFNQGRELISGPIDFGIVSLFAVTELSGKLIQLERCYPRLTGWDDRVALVWNQIPEGSRAYFAYNIFLQFFDSRGKPLGKKKALSSYRYLCTRPDITVNGDRLAVVWHEVMGDFSHVFFTEVNREGKFLKNRVRLDLKKASSFRPRIVAVDEREYLVFWNRVEGEGAFLVSKNTLYPEEPSLWYRIGLLENQPIQSLVYVFVTDLILSAIYAMPGIGLVVIGYLVFYLLTRLVGAKWFERHYYLVSIFIFSLFFLLQETPVYFFRPFGIPAALKFINFILASGITIFFFDRLRRHSKWTGLRTSMGQLVVMYTWVYFYTFLTLVPYFIYNLNM